MKRKRIWVLLLVLSILLVLPSGLVFAGGDDEAVGTTSDTAEMAITTSEGFSSYNLNEYGQKIISFGESPMLAARVRAGKLPPVGERLPDNPLVMETWEEIGRFGGMMQIVGFSAEMRRFNSSPLFEFVYEAGFGREGKRLGADLRPGVLESWDFGSDGKTFTFTIREGLKWSDGIPVTTEDVEFYFNDVMMNEEITPNLPRWANWGGEPVELKIIDKYTFQFTFASEYGGFPWDVDVFWNQGYFPLMPKHFGSRFHKKYTAIEKLLPLMKQEEFTTEEEWGSFFRTVMDFGYPEYVSSPYYLERPILGPWVMVQKEEDIAYTFERNPFYYKIDPEGNQLPYIDTIRQELVGNSIETINLKIISGEIDFVAESLPLENYPLYMDNRDKGGYNVMLLPYWRGFANIIVVNYTIPDDPVLEDIFQNLDFRHALSLAINREEMQDALYLGFGEAVQFSSPPASPWYEPEFETAWAEYDVDEANRLLDKIGLKWDGKKEFRLRPDGKRLILRLEYCTPFHSEGEMIQSYWKDIGIDLDVKYMDGSVFYPLYGAGDVQMTLRWSAEPEPTDYAYFSHPARITGGTWGAWISSFGKNGAEPPEWVKKVYEDRDLLFSTPDMDERIEAGKRIAAFLANYLWNIGMAGRLPVPVIYNNKLGNISVAKDLNVYGFTLMEAAPQWFFKE